MVSVAPVVYVAGRPEWELDTVAEKTQQLARFHEFRNRIESKTRIDWCSYYVGVHVVVRRFESWKEIWSGSSHERLRHSASDPYGLQFPMNDLLLRRLRRADWVLPPSRLHGLWLPTSVRIVPLPRTHSYPREDHL